MAKLVKITQLRRALRTEKASVLNDIPPEALAALSQLAGIWTPRKKVIIEH